MLSTLFANPSLFLAANQDSTSALILFALACVVVLVVVFSHELKKRQQHAWKGFAKALHGSYNPEPTPTGVIKTRLQGTQVTIYTEANANGASLALTTHVSTPMHGANDFSLSLSPEGLLTSVGKAFGSQDIVLGDHAFDHKFIVKSNDELFCRLWLNAMIRPQLLLLETYTLSIEQGAIRLSKLGVEHNLAKLKHAAEVCAKLGKQTPKLSENWLGLAKRFDARIKNAKGKNPLPHNTQLELEYHGCRYRLEVISTTHAGILTRLTAEKPSAIGLFSIAPSNAATLDKTAHELHLPLMPKQYRVLAHQQEDASRTINESVIQTIQKITPYSIASTQHHLEILLPGFVYAPETIKTALDLATTLISQTQGPYR